MLTSSTCAFTTRSTSLGLHAIATRPRVRAHVELIDTSELLPYLGLVVALGSGAAYLATDFAGEADRTRASQLPMPASSPPQGLAYETSEAAALKSTMTSDDFPSAWSRTVGALGQRVSSGNSSLQTRIAEVQAIPASRRALSECLGVSVERQLHLAQSELLPSVASIGPDAPLPPRAVTLVRASQFLPGQSARQMRAFVTESAPSSDPTVAGRFDREQAAKLYMGAIQFGYFLGQVFLGQADLDEEAVLTAAEAQALSARIQRATREMKSEIAWAAASRRAGRVLCLPTEATAEDGESSGLGSSLGGVELLREFTTGVQVVGAGQQEEFFSAGSTLDGEGSEGEGEGDEGGATVAGDIFAGQLFGNLPVGDFVRFNAAGLQAMLAEACLFGWFLWKAEAEASDVLGPGPASDTLLVPPAISQYTEGQA